MWVESWEWKMAALKDRLLVHWRVDQWAENSVGQMAARMECQLVAEWGIEKVDSKDHSWVLKWAGQWVESKAQHLVDW